MITAFCNTVVVFFNRHLFLVLGSRENNNNNNIMHQQGLLVGRCWPGSDRVQVNYV
jgi:hypothetical protein